MEAKARTLPLPGEQEAPLGGKASGGHVNRSLGQGDTEVALQLAPVLSLCARPRFWCSSPWRTHNPWLMHRKFWDKDTVTLEVLLTGHLLKAWMKGPELQTCCWASRNRASPPSNEQAGL